MYHLKLKCKREHLKVKVFVLCVLLVVVVIIITLRKIHVRHRAHVPRIPEISHLLGKWKIVGGPEFIILHVVYLED